MSNWTWDDLVNMRAYQPVERQPGTSEWQPHDPQDYRDRYPMAPDPSLAGMVRPAASSGLMGLFESPPFAGTSRGIAAVMRGENPLRATADMTGDSPEIWEELQARGVNPWLALGAEVAVPSMLSFIGDANDIASAGRWAARNIDNLAPLAASLFPASRMARYAPSASGWDNALREITQARWGSGNSVYDAGRIEFAPPGERGLLDSIVGRVKGADWLETGDVRISSGSGSIDLYEAAGRPNSLEIYMNAGADSDDLARVMDLADAGEVTLITSGDSIPYDLARRLGFVEESLGGPMVRHPVDTEPFSWYADMYARIRPDDPTELRRAAGLEAGPGEIEAELRLIIAESDLDWLEKGTWQELIDSSPKDEASLGRIINAMTEEGIIPKIPGEDFVSRGPGLDDIRDLPDPDDLFSQLEDISRRTGGGGPGAGGIAFKDADDISEWARKIKKAQDDAIRRGSPFTTGEWMNFFEIEGVRMPTGDPANPLRPLTMDEVMRLESILKSGGGLPAEMSSAQIADIIASEFVTKIGGSEVDDFGRVLTGMEDSMLMRENAISLLRSTDVELTPKIAGNVIESFFAIRPEDIGRTGSELIEWMDSVQRAYKGARGSGLGASRYNVNEVLNRGLADLKIVASRPMASGGYATEYDLLAAVRRMGLDADGMPNNVFDVVDELHKIYPTIPLEQLESIAEMALL